MKLGLFLLLAMVPLLSFGQVDTTAVDTQLTDATTAIENIGTLMLGAAGAGIAIKWILGFLF
jgi:hypothetical protein